MGLRAQCVLKCIWGHRVTPELSNHMLIMKIECVVPEILDVLLDALKFNEISRNLRFSCIYTKIWWYLKWNVQSLTMKIFWTTHPKNMKKYPLTENQLYYSTILSTKNLDTYLQRFWRFYIVEAIFQWKNKKIENFMHL